MTDLSTPIVSIGANTNGNSHLCDLIVTGSRNVDELVTLRERIQAAGFQQSNAERHGDIVSWTLSLPPEEAFGDGHVGKLELAITEAGMEVLH